MLDTVADLLSDLDATGTGTNLRHPLALEVHPMLRPHSGVVHVASKIAQARDRGRVPSCSKANAGDEPSTVDFRAIGAVHQPLVLVLVKLGSIDMPVIFDMLLNIPLLLDVFEVASQLRPAGIALGEGEVLPEVLVEKLIDWSIAVDACARVAVPVLSALAQALQDLRWQFAYPDAATCATLLVNRDTEAQLAQSIEESKRGKAGSYKENVHIRDLRLAHGTHDAVEIAK